MTTRRTPAPTTEQSTERRARQRWMSVLAKADFGDLDTLWNNLPSKPAWTVVRAPEVGMVMVRGRAGEPGSASTSVRPRSPGARSSSTTARSASGM